MLFLSHLPFEKVKHILTSWIILKEITLFYQPELGQSSALLPVNLENLPRMKLVFFKMVTPQLGDLGWLCANEVLLSTGYSGQQAAADTSKQQKQADHAAVHCLRPPTA